MQVAKFIVWEYSAITLSFPMIYITFIYFYFGPHTAKALQILVAQIRIELG